MLGRWIVVICSVSLFTVAATNPAAADIPRKINYQGSLTDADTGEPLVGSYELTFNLYGQASGGSFLWSESRTVATDSAGVFSIVLGSTVPIDVSFEGPCWLEVQVAGETLTPRRELVSVPYAFQALSADSLGGLASASFALAEHFHDELYVNEGQAGSITAEMIVDGAGSGLDADLVDGQHAVAFAGAAHQHDDRYYAETELNTTGTINQVSNPVDWTKLKSVPGGFADGTDNVGAGDGHSLDAADGSPTDVVYVANDGNVGINVTNPTLGKLQVLTTAGTAICGTSNDGAGVYGFSQNNNGVLGVSNNGKAGAFVGEVYVSGRVDSDSGFSIDGRTLLSAPGQSNLFVGRDIVGEGPFVQDNTCVGDSVGCVHLGQNNTFVGYKAGRGSKPYAKGDAGLATSFNDYNVFVGSKAGYQNYGAYNVFVGRQAGLANTSGALNTLVGSGAGRSVVDGSDNLFLGTEAGQDNVSGSANVLCGPWAGSSRQNESENTYVGMTAGGSNYGGLGEIGSQNTGVGARAGMNADGSRNVFLGYESGYGVNGSDKLYIANGSDPANVLVYGDFAQHRVGIGTTSPDRLLHLKGDGPRVLVEASSGNPEVNLKLTGDATGEVWAIYKHSVEEDLRFYQNGDRVTLENGTGNVAIGATDPLGYRLYVNGTAYATVAWQSSDRRLKTDLLGIDDALGKILRLNGISFRWRTEEYGDRGLPEGRHYGLVAQEVEQVLPEVVGNGPDGEKALAYSEIIPVLVESVKQLKAENDALRARLDALEER